MSPTVSGLVGVVAVLALMALGMPVGLSLILVGFVGFMYLSNAEAALSVVGSEVYQSLYNYGFITIPLFVLMGSVAAHSQIGARFYSAVDRWLGQLPGGLAIATIAGCAGFASVSSSSMATASTMCRLSFPEMEKRGYKPELSAGALATGGTLGILIPPSSVLIMYGIITEQSIGKLFVAGIVPGLILTSLMIAVILVWTRIDPCLAPRSQVVASLREKVASLGGSVEVLLLFALVIGGMFSGLFTPTEAGGVGAAGAIVIAVVRRMLTRAQLSNAIVETARISAMIALVLIGAVVFNSFLSLSRVPFEMAGMVASLPLPPVLIISVIIITYLIMGCFIDSLSIVLITVPIYFPLVTKLGYDPIWFGVIIVVMVEIAMISPPMGANVFVISGMLPKIPIQTIFKGASILLIANLALVVLLMIFPQIALFLPNLMR